MLLYSKLSFKSFCLTTGSLCVYVLLLCYDEKSGLMFIAASFLCRNRKYVCMGVCVHTCLCRYICRRCVCDAVCGVYFLVFDAIFNGKHK